MYEFLIDSFRLLLGIGFGFLALLFAFATARLVLFGQDAYNINRRVSHVNPVKSFSGQLENGVDDEDKRASHGIAFNLSTGELIEQKRLSTEAIDDVIGRHAA